MKGIYQFFVDCGRMGSLEGVFIEDKDVVETMIKEAPEMYFGEVLGKHSEIIIDLQPHHIELLSDDQTAVDVLLKVLGTDIVGFNPIDYWDSESKPEGV